MSQASTSFVQACGPTKDTLSFCILAWTAAVVATLSITILLHIAVAVLHKLCVQVDTLSLPERGA